MKHQLLTVSLFVLLALLVSVGGATAHTGSPDAPIVPPNNLLQFTAGGHIFGFRAGEFYLTNATYALRVQFVGAKQVAPQSDMPTESSEQGAPALQRVTYANLWDGITLAYEAVSGGLARSSYRLEPGADASAIRLRYNAPVTLNDDGTLTLAYATGQMSESAPVAWQEVDGQRVAVAVAFMTSKDLTVGFTVGNYDAARPLFIDPTLTWNTFLGGSGTDEGYAIAVDGSGNVYVVGRSTATWTCSPTTCTVRAYTSGSDAFAAKLNSSGVLQWNTFLGGSGSDYGNAIAVDGSGNAYVAGHSAATWGSPVRAYTSGSDAFAAKLNSSGALQWNTFLGDSGSDYGNAIAVDGSGNVCVAGYSNVSWQGTTEPVRAYSSVDDTFAAKLDSSGGLTWNTFLGGSGTDQGYAIAVDGSGSIYVAGYSAATWGSPVRAHDPGANLDTFATKLTSSGVLQWNTFLGGSGSDYGNAIAVDGSGNAYVAGHSAATWGSPVRAYSGSPNDAFAAKLDPFGALQWNTFLGGNGDDYSYAITADGSGSVYVAGYSDATWGPPVRAHDPGANFDAFAAKLNSSGILQWNTFLGGSGADPGRGIAVDGSGNVYVAGYSSATWGSPLRAFGGGTYDAFAAKLPPDKTYADTAGVCGGNLPCYTTIGNALGGVMDTVGSVDIYAATYAEDVSLASGVTLNLLGATTLNGNLTIGSGTTFNATSGTFSLTGNFTNSGTFNANSGTVTFNGTTNLSGNTTFKAVTINSGKTVNAGSTTTTIQGSISNSGTFNGETGTVILSGSYSRTLSGSGTYNFNNLTVDASGGTVNLSINVTIHVAGDFTKSAGSFTCNSASDATINTCTLDFNGGGTSSFSWTNSSVLPWNITIQSGTSVNLGASNSTFTLRGSLGGDGTLSASGGTIIFDTVTTSLISGSKTFNNVTVNSTTTLQLSANANFGYKGTFTLTGSFDATTNSPTTVTIASTSAQQLPSGATTLRNLTINSGASLTAPSSLSIAGDFTNSGTFTHNSGTVTFNGSGTQNLTANVATAFYNLTVNSGVTLVETVSDDNASIASGGTLTNSGTIRKSQNIGTTGNYTFGLAGGPINSANLSINVTTDNFTSIQVDRKDSSHPNATDPLKTGYYWTLTPDGSGTVNLTLPVTFTTDTKDRVCRYTGSEQVWDCDYSSHTANSITRDGVTTFSDWAAGDDVGPTAITLSSLTARPFAPQPTLFRWPWLALAGAVVFGGGAVARRLLGR